MSKQTRRIKSNNITNAKSLTELLPYPIDLSSFVNFDQISWILTEYPALPITRSDIIQQPLLSMPLFSGTVILQLVTKLIAVSF